MRTEQNKSNGAAPPEVSGHDATGESGLRGLIENWVLGDGATCAAGALSVAALPKIEPSHSLPRNGGPAPASSADGKFGDLAPTSGAATPVNSSVGTTLSSWLALSGAPFQPARAAPASAGPAPARLIVPVAKSALRAPALTARPAPRPVASSLVRRTNDTDVERRRVALNAQIESAIEQFASSRRKVEFTAALRALKRVQTRLGRTNRLVIAGGVNSGKSSLANQIIGAKLLPTGAERSSYIPTRVHFASAAVATGVKRDGTSTRLRLADGAPNGEFVALTLGVPSVSLKALDVVDLPGWEHDDQHHSDDDLLGRDVRGDMLIWCTSSPAAWSADERQFWREQPQWLKRRSLLIITHPDRLTSTRPTERLLRRIFDQAEGEFRDILLMSTAEPSERSSRRVKSWLKQFAREVNFDRVEGAARVAARILRKLESRLVAS